MALLWRMSITKGPPEPWALLSDAASGGSEAGLAGSTDLPPDSGATKPTRITARSTATADARPIRPFCVCLAWSLLPSPRLVSVIVSAFCLSCADDGEVHALVRATTAYTCPEPTTGDVGTLRYDVQGAALGMGLKCDEDLPSRSTWHLHRDR